MNTFTRILQILEERGIFKNTKKNQPENCITNIIINILLIASFLKSIPYHSQVPFVLMPIINPLAMISIILCLFKIYRNVIML